MEEGGREAQDVGAQVIFGFFIWSSAGLSLDLIVSTGAIRAGWSHVFLESRTGVPNLTIFGRGEVQGNSAPVSFLLAIYLSVFYNVNCLIVILFYTRLEQESGFYFNIKNFEDQVLAGEWDEVEKYLSGFTKVEDNRYSMKIFFEIRKQKYLEALDRCAIGSPVSI